MRASFRKLGWFVLCVFLMGNAHICFADNLTLAEAFFTRPESVSGMIDVPGKGPMRYYAQNDALWGALVYEQGDVSSSRPFRDSGCGPTATAMAIAALVPESGLRRISDYAVTPYALCECSVNNARCNHRHGRYLLTSDRDYARFLPLIFADFATGNNTFGVYSRGAAIGTSSGFIKSVAAAYGLDYRYIADYDEAVDALKSGSAVVAAASRGGAFTNTGHYVFLAHMDEEKLYILDPLCRTEYKTTGGNKLEIIQPGLVALTHENVRAAQLNGFHIFTVNDGSMK